MGAGYGNGGGVALVRGGGSSFKSRDGAEEGGSPPRPGRLGTESRPRSARCAPGQGPHLPRAPRTRQKPQGRGHGREGCEDPSLTGWLGHGQRGGAALAPDMGSLHPNFRAPAGILGEGTRVRQRTITKVSASFNHDSHLILQIIRVGLREDALIAPRV